jgi:chromate transporter
LTTSTPPSRAAEAAPLRAFAAYFLRLGALGFGGPIALVGAMQRDLVEARGWVSRDDYLEGLALAQLAPGPLAAQLAIYLGWVRAGVWGATVVGAAFILPSFLIVLALSAFYLRAGGLAWMQGAFYGVGAAAIAVIARGAWKLARLTLGKDALLWAVFVLNAVLTAALQRELVWVLVLSGTVVLAARTASFGRTAALLVPWPLWLTAGLHGPAAPGTLGTVAWFFTKAGAVVFGSGLAILPFLYGGVVSTHHWLTDRQFLDAVAVAMITPGPVVITVAFIGFLVAGPAGACVAAAGVFAPVYLFVVLPARWFRRGVKHEGIRAFVAGVTAGASGAIAGAAFVLATRAIVDLPTALLALGALAVLVFVRRVPEPVVMAVAGLAGMLLAG